MNLPSPVITDAVLDTSELLRLVGLTPGDLGQEVLLRPSMPVKVPREYVALMARGDAADPLLRQVLPLASEQARSPGLTADPLGERQSSPVPCLLHKYRGRALLLASDRCAVHCRFCFRRCFPFHQHHPSQDALAQALDHIRGDHSLEEIILSGGDPLTLTLERLGRLCRALEGIPHLRRLRVHSRLPVVAPGRVPPGLEDLLGGLRQEAVVVIHANHPRELSEGTAGVLSRLAGAGVTLLNQSVLLRGVNDGPEVLQQLSEGLFERGVLPYYLHLLDPVEGAGHFAVPPGRARQIMARLAARLPGYLVPRLVQERPGEPFKCLLGSGSEQKDMGDRV